MSVRSKATVEDLYHLPENGKAEIVNGELVLMPPTGDMPSRAGFNIASSLREFERQNPIGRAYPDNTGYKVNLPNRDFFSPDASFYTGKATGMKFLEGSPVFAAEVRSSLTTFSRFFACGIVSSTGRSVEFRFAAERCR